MMLRKIGVLLAFALGTPLWILFFVYLGNNPFGRIDFWGFCLFASPIVGFIMPLSGHLIQAERPVVAVWLLALAPLLSIFGFVLTIAVIGEFKANGHMDSDRIIIAHAVSSLVWFMPLIVTLIRPHFRKNND